MDGRVVSTLPTPEGPLMFDTSGRWLATRPYEKEIASVRIWDTRTGTAAGVINQEDRLDDVLLSGDGQYLFTTGYLSYNVEGPIRLYRVADGREIVQLPAPGDPCAVMALDERARFVVCATRSYTSRVTIKQLLPPEPLAEACTRVLRELTEEEWRRYLPGEPRRTSCD